MRDLLFLFVLLIAAVSIVTGVALWSVPSAFVLAGLLFAAIGWLTLTGDDETDEPAAIEGDV